MENKATTPASKSKRYRVLLSEVLSYCVDVLADSEEQACEIAAETEMKGEPKTESFDVDYCEDVEPDDDSFSPVNACWKCLQPMEDFEKNSLCPSCRKDEDAATRAA